jgi:hypothetical protein
VPQVERLQIGSPDLLDVQVFDQDTAFHDAHPGRGVLGMEEIVRRR